MIALRTMERWQDARKKFPSLHTIEEMGCDLAAHFPPHLRELQPSQVNLQPFIDKIREIRPEIDFAYPGLLPGNTYSFHAVVSYILWVSTTRSLESI